MLRHQTPNGSLRPITEYNEIRYTKVKNLNIVKNKIQRAGVILYNTDGTELMFYLGIDRKTNEITDFSGGLKKNESIIKGALREFHEETMNTFTNIKLDTIQDYYIVYDNFMAIIFIPINFDLAFVNQKLSTSHTNEVTKMVQIKGSNFSQDFLYNTNMYQRLSIFLKNLYITNKEFFDLL